MLITYKRYSYSLMLTYHSTFSGFSVDDLARAKEFYGTKLGLDVKETPQGLSLTLTGGNTIFIYPKPDHVPATFTVHNFLVEDIDTAVDELAAAGVCMERYDMGEMVADEKGIYRAQEAADGPTIAWFLDPAGNILSVIQD